MKISIMTTSLSTLAFGLVFVGHFGYGGSTWENSAAPEAQGSEREAVERLGPYADRVEKELEHLEQQVEIKGSLTIAEYREIQSQLDELLGQLNEKSKTVGYADSELFGELLELQEKVAGIDVH